MRVCGRQADCIWPTTALATVSSSLHQGMGKTCWGGEEPFRSAKLLLAELHHRLSDLAERQDGDIAELFRNHFQVIMCSETRLGGQERGPLVGPEHGWNRRYADVATAGLITVGGPSWRRINLIAHLLSTVPYHEVPCRRFDSPLRRRLPTTGDCLASTSIMCRITLRRSETTDQAMIHIFGCFAW